MGERGDGPREVHGRHFASHGRVILEPLLIAEQTDRDHHEVDEITGLRERLVHRALGVRRVSGVEKHSVDSAGAAVERFRGRLIEESLVSAGQHDGVGARGAEPLGQGARDVGTPGEHDHALRLSERVLHVTLPRG